MQFATLLGTQRNVLQQTPTPVYRKNNSRYQRAVAAVAAPPSPQVGATASPHAVANTRLLTAVKTPFLQNGKFDLDAYDAHVQNQIDNGVEGLIVGGTTGEGQLMLWDEHIMLIAHTINVFGNKIYVIGNTGSNSTREALHATEQGFSVGMHAALQINPYYGKTSKEGLLFHFNSCLDLGPAIIYNVPSRTGQDIPDGVIMSLSGHENFLGVKECTGNDRIKSYAEKGVKCWSGNDDQAHDARHKFDGQGVVSVTSNLLPGLFSSMMKEQNDELNNSLQELMGWLFCEPNPIPLNTAMAMCGLVKPVFRLPYVPLRKDQREIGAKLLEKVKDHIPGCKEIRVMEDDEFTCVGMY
eukprot:TRINITY_DN3770_c0_g1_i2.p1 TRINITY_DN3770_c0_g1~~TRINITY_DN3770_c0_g1_i2.p1  ORF type:complete len:379 (-),score=37.11 TRINITY_DN3770_c0_g1_i2:544-1605(-)